MPEIRIEQVSADADFGTLIQHIADAEWDEANEITPSDYTEKSLADFVAHDRSILVFAYIDDEFAGMTAGTIQAHPHKTGRWLYIDEVDTAVNHRRKGVGRAMMEWCFDFAKREGLYEVALGTERENETAQKLYKSLDPSDTEDVIWYMYEVEDE